MADAAPAVTLERLRGTIRDLVSLTSGTEAAHLRRRPADGGWSPAVVLAHLAHAEHVNGVRLRMVVTQDEPLLAAFDEQAWADRLAPLEDDPRDTLARWRVLRDDTLRVLESVTAEEWGRVGMHQERGRLTLGQLAAVLADHDAAHLDQLRAALR